MKNIVVLFILLITYQLNTVAQVAVNNNGNASNNSAMLDISSSNKGFLIPRLTIAQRDSIENPDNGLIVFSTDNNTISFFDTTNNRWQDLKSSLNNHTISDADGDTYISIQPQTNSDTIKISVNDTIKWMFIKNSLYSVNNGYAVYIGEGVGTSTLGTSNENINRNVCIGYFAGHNYTDYNGGNVVVGHLALFSDTSGYFNVAIGTNTLYENLSGIYNVAIGTDALHHNITGNKNTAIGNNALLNNTKGGLNIAIGELALEKNLKSRYNMAIGYRALSNIVFDTAGTAYSDTSGHNIAIGEEALYSPGNRSFSYDDVAVGYRSGYKNIRGHGNTAVGKESLRENTNGNFNTAFGFEALLNNVTGSYNSALGCQADVATGNLENSTAIGYAATVTASNEVRVGNANITSIGGQKSWSVLSDGRFKTDVKEDVEGLEFILALRPITYVVDHDKYNQFVGRRNMVNSRRLSDYRTGFVAEEVGVAAQNLGFEFSGVSPPDNEKDYYSLRYGQFVVPLVKAMQEQEVQIKQQQKILDEQEKMLKQLLLDVQKAKKILVLSN
jgi:hypothetical protein